jgi:hypothetical protein
MALAALSASFSQSEGGAALHWLRRDWIASASVEQVALSCSTVWAYEALVFTHCHFPDTGSVALGVPDCEPEQDASAKVASASGAKLRIIAENFSPLYR